MRETNIFDYWRFGYNYYVLRFTTEGLMVHGKGNTLIELLDEFFEYLDRLELFVSKKAAYDLRRIRKEAGELPVTSKVDSSLAKRIEEACDRVDATLDAELKLKNAFVLTPKRFQLEHLLKAPANLFGTKVFEELPLICQFDFTEACRSLAFGLPTAAAFHLMRGTEGVLRHYYSSIVKRNRIKRLLWYDMVTHLRQRKNPPPKPLLDNLDNIRVNFRNPTQHPDARYDMDEAQDLFALSVEVVNRMIKDLAKNAA